MPDKNPSVLASTKATVIAKVIRADGTEETFISHDVSVRSVKDLEASLRELPPDPEPDAAALAHERNAAESAKNMERNEQAIAEARRAAKEDNA